MAHLQKLRVHCVVVALLLSSTSAIFALAFTPSKSFMRGSMNSRTHTLIKMSSTDNNNEKPTVAIIGGGIAGLSCAQHLQSFYHPTVFDTGRIRPGGRCSSRYPNDKPKGKKGNQDSVLSQHTIDHAAQILSVPRGNEFGKFRMQVDRWVDAGVLKNFPKDSVVEIVDVNRKNKMKKKGESKEDGSKKDNQEQSPPKRNTESDIQIRSLNSADMYYSTDGMGSIPLNILNSSPDVKIHQDVWISPGNGVKFVGTGDSPEWSVQTNGKQFGTYDHVVIAHNGKCADRLMSKTPAKDLHSLLRVDFKPFVPNWGGKRMTLNSIYSLTIALKKGEDGQSALGSKLNGDQGKGVITAFIKNEPTLRLLTNQSRKFSSRKNDKVEVITILSSAKFAKKYKGPQENLPRKLEEDVTSLMLAALERSLGLKEDTIHEGLIMEKKLQLWGAAVPLNVWSVTEDDATSGSQSKKSGFIYDSEYAVGVCGDWLLDPSVAGAWESGRRLANWLVESDGQTSIGLPPNGKFRASRSASESGIGSVR